MTYSAGDLVKFIPQHPMALEGHGYVGMVGMVLSTKPRGDDEYLPVLWADGKTIDTHLNDLEPFNWLPCVPTRP